MQQDNTILNKLQQLENQQLPDLSHMDAHWQQMQAMLVPAAKQVKSKRWLWLIPVVLLLVTTAVWLGRSNDVVTTTASTTAPITTQAALQDTIPTATWTTSGDTLKLIQQTPITTIKGKRNSGNNNDIAVLPGRTDTQYFNITFIPCKDSNTTTKNAGNLQQQWLSDLFAQLQKEPNLFVIDNRKDTLLFCQEGTALRIPAGSLGSYASVQFMVKEIYKKSDIVLNQLSATSNKALLETGGMLQLNAYVNDEPIDVEPGKPIMVFMTDTSSYMQQMQLFMGKKTTEYLPTSVVRFNEKMENTTSDPVATYINWIPQSNIYFTKQQIMEEVRVLDLGDEPAKTIETRRGLKAIFRRAPGSQFSKKQLRQMLQDRHGDTYYKIKVKGQRRSNIFNNKGLWEYSQIGDSVWMSKAAADKMKWPYRETRQTKVTFGEARVISTNTSIAMGKGLQTINNRYGVSIDRLGWINCDRFYNGVGEKTDYVVQLGDSAANYYTLLVFNNINSVMSGYVSGKTALFPNVPEGMDVTVVSVGINNKGQAVYAMQKATTNKAGLSGIQYQLADAATLPNTLKQLDK